MDIVFTNYLDLNTHRFWLFDIVFLSFFLGCSIFFTLPVAPEAKLEDVEFGAPGDRKGSLR